MRHRIGDNWRRVTEQVAEACHAVGREPSEVRIVGVTKYVGPELAWELAQAGCRWLGENRPQSLWAKFEHCAAIATAEGTESPEWHLIGHLQRNKLRRTLPMIGCLHSLDSLRLAQAISQEMAEQPRPLAVLVEVNPTGDASKTGLAPEDLPRLVEELVALPGIRLRGLMAMSSLGGSLDTARREFESVRALRDRLQAGLADRADLGELSMGMSGDFIPAIAAGATLVRIGSSLWDGVLDR